MTLNICKIKWGEKESRYKKEKMIKEMEKGKKGKKKLEKCNSKCGLKGE